MLNKLPRDLPTNPCMKPFIIGATDKRRGLRGQWGVRATANLAAGTFLGMYRGRVSFLKNYDEEKLKGPGSNGHENAMTNDAYCATIQVS